MVHDIDKTSITDLAKNQALVQSILAKNPTWTDSDVRRKLDQAYSVINGFKTKKINKVEELKQVKVDGEVCPECGSSNLIRTGVCRACLNCGKSLGCS